MRILRATVAVSLALALNVTASRPAVAADHPASDGHLLYVLYCESCHGVTGRGDGVDADILASPPRDLRSGVLARYPVDDLVRRIRSGVPLELALDLPALQARAGQVEALAAHLERLPTVNWRLVEEGQAIYLDRCELCHGRTGKSELTLPPGARTPRDLSDSGFQREFNDEMLATVVRHGRRGMPGIEPPVHTRELPALMAFIRLLSPGYVLYDRYCAACHGDDGHGTGSFAEEADRPTIAFDRRYFQRRDPEQVRTAIWHMLATKRPAMPHFRRLLSAAEVRAVILYLQRAE